MEDTNVCDSSKSGYSDTPLEGGALIAHWKGGDCRGRPGRPYRGGQEVDGGDAATLSMSVLYRSIASFQTEPCSFLFISVIYISWLQTYNAFIHSGECNMVPDPVRGNLLELQSASSKGSKGLATR